MLSHSVLRPGITPIYTTSHGTDFAEPDAKSSGNIIVSDAGANIVDVLTTAGKPVATISANLSEPQGLATDKTGNLYIANTGASDIIVYKSDYKTVSATLSDPGQYPVGVSVSAGSGLVGVTNIITTGGLRGSVSFYGVGKTTPCNTVYGAGFSRVYFGAFDAHGNYFVDGQNALGATLVGEVSGGCAAKGIVTLKTSNAITFPGGIEVTPAGTIAIDDQSGPNIYTYSAPTASGLGSPVATTPLTGAGDPVTFAFNAAASDVYTADAVFASAYEYAYPKGGNPIQTITDNFIQPIGVAVTPAEIP